MSEHSGENGALEVLGCIYCGETINWPRVRAYPCACLHCGRWPGAYTARVVPPDPFTTGPEDTSSERGSR